MEDEAPVVKGHVPFLLDIHQGQVDRLLGRLVVGKLDLGLDIFSDTSVDVLDGIGGIDDPADFQGEGKVAGQIFPIVAPGQDGMLVLGLPLAGKAFQGMFGRLLVRGSVDILEIGAKFLAILPYHIFAAIADLMDDAQLGNRVRENAPDGIRKAF